MLGRPAQYVRERRSMASIIPKVSIDTLIDIVEAGGKIRTGIDVFNKQGRLILEKDILVSSSKILLNVKKFGIHRVPIVSDNKGGLWDCNGNPIVFEEAAPVPEGPPPKGQAAAAKGKVSEIDRKIRELMELKGIASEKYTQAKDCIKQVLESIQATGGQFDFGPIEKTVNELVDFIAAHESAFSYVTREIFSYDDYLYNHSINVCTIGTVVMRKFNENFNSVVNNFLKNANAGVGGESDPVSFRYFHGDELRDISIGYFMHDLGKVLIDKEILNKPGKLTDSEFEIVKSHSTSKGLELFERNRLSNPYIINISQYHHARLFSDEERCYPVTKDYLDIPAYVKVGKLADIYDAMTSKRSYKEALNPVGVVSDIFRKYAQKDVLLQYILHSFVKSVGIYPPGSIVALTNGQLAYILDSEGPILLPVTDTHGETLKTKPDIINLGGGEEVPGAIKVDRRKPPVAPVEAYKILPEYLKKILAPTLEAASPQ